MPHFENFFSVRVYSNDSVCWFGHLLAWDLTQNAHATCDKLISSLLLWVTPGIYAFAKQNIVVALSQHRHLPTMGCLERLPANATHLFYFQVSDFQLWVWRNLQSSLSAIYVCQVTENGGKCGLRGVPHDNWRDFTPFPRLHQTSRNPPRTLLATGGGTLQP